MNLNGGISMEISQSGDKWRVRYSVLAVLWLGWLFSFLDRMVISISLPFIGSDFNINSMAQGAILSSFFAGYSIFQIPGGLLADKFGFRRILSIGITWWSMFTTMTGMVLSYPTMLIVRCLFGLGEGCFPGASWKAISTYFPRKQKGTATAIQSTVNTLGPAVASVVAAAIIAAYGWRRVFLLLGIPGVLIGVFIWFKFKDNPAEHPKMTKEELAELNQDFCEGEDKSRVSFKDFLTKPILWQMVLIWFLFDITFWGFVSWLPTYLMKVRGFSLIKTGIYGSLPYLVGTVSIILGGYLSDHTKGQRKWLFIPNAFVSGLFLYLTYKAPTTNMCIVYQCTAAFFMFLAQGAFWGLVVDSMPPSIAGASTGTVNLGGQIAGFISPFVMGYLIHVSGGSFDTAFIFIILAIIASAMVAFTVDQSASSYN
jgi:sugar phosphate permease